MKVRGNMGVTEPGGGSTHKFQIGVLVFLVYYSREEQFMCYIGVPQETLFVEPLELPCAMPVREIEQPNPLYVPEPEPIEVPA